MTNNIEEQQVSHEEIYEWLIEYVNTKDEKTNSFFRTTNLGENLLYFRYYSFSVHFERSNIGCVQ